MWLSGHERLPRLQRKTGLLQQRVTAVCNRFLQQLPRKRSLCRPQRALRAAVLGRAATLDVRAAQALMHRSRGGNLDTAARVNVNGKTSTETNSFAAVARYQRRRRRQAVRADRAGRRHRPGRGQRHPACTIPRCRAAMPSFAGTTTATRSSTSAAPTAPSSTTEAHHRSRAAAGRPDRRSARPCSSTAPAGERHRSAAQAISPSDQPDHARRRGARPRRSSRPSARAKAAASSPSPTSHSPWLKTALANLSIMYEASQAISHILDLNRAARPHPRADLPLHRRRPRLLPACASRTASDLEPSGAALARREPTRQ